MLIVVCCEILACATTFRFQGFELRLDCGVFWELSFSSIEGYLVAYDLYMNVWLN